MIVRARVPPPAPPPASIAPLPLVATKLVMDEGKHSGETMIELFTDGRVVDGDGGPVAPS